MARYVGFKMGKVHESHTVSDYYCGRCGYPVTDHDSYCPECGGAFRECDADCLEDETRNLKAENAKLRELAMDVVRYAEPEFHIGLKYNVFCTRECQLRDSVCPSSDECKYPEYLHERLRELGIEVDDGQDVR